MAGLLSFFIETEFGSGGKLYVYAFDDDSYEEVNKRLEKGNLEPEEVGKYWHENALDWQHCLVQIIELDGMYPASGEGVRVPAW